MIDSPSSVSQLPYKTIFRMQRMILYALVAWVCYIYPRGKKGSLSNDIGLGQSYATLVNLSFTVWCYVTPIFGAIIADQYIGRKATITHASRVYAVGLFILFGSSLSVFKNSDVSILALLAAMLLIGIGAGGIRPNVNSLIAEQYQPADQPVHKLDTGENISIDHDMTIQRSVQSLLCICSKPIGNLKIGSL